MERGKAARQLIAEGEDPFRMLAVVWPARNWADELLRTRLVACSACSDEVGSCECGNTGLSVARAVA
jgi:hypothetical protein